MAVNLGQNVQATLDIQETVKGAATLIAEAIGLLQDNIRNRLKVCQQNGASAAQCIDKAIRDALTTVYSDASNSTGAVADNLAYLMSAAQQYASILGVPGVTPDISGVPTSIPRTFLEAQVVADLPQGKQLHFAEKPITTGEHIVAPSDLEFSPSYDVVTGITPDALSGGTILGWPLPTLLPTELNVGTQPAAAPVSVPTSASSQPSPVVSTEPQSISPVSSGSVGVTPPAAISPMGTSIVSGQVVRTLPGAGSISTPIAPHGAPPEGPITRGFPGRQGTFGGTSGGVIPTIIQGTPPIQSPTPPTSTGCPTSVVGLPTREDIYNGLVIPRNGMWIACQGVVAQITTDLALANQMGACGSWTVDGVNYYAVVDPTCPANNQTTTVPAAPPQVIPPAEPGKDTCDNLPADKTKWTPWQQANCGTGQINTGQTCPAPIVQCPTIPSNLTFDPSALCKCIQDALATANPVDLDQPLAFRFAPDDNLWKRNAMAFAGKPLDAFLASASGEEYLDWIDQDSKAPAAIDDPWDR
jgi:hypothetical protein